MDTVRMLNRTGNERMPTESEYRSAVAEFDRLWGMDGSPQDLADMEGLIHLIDAFENKNRSNKGERN
jgi:hypothetical protein